MGNGASRSIILRRMSNQSSKRDAPMPLWREMPSELVERGLLGLGSRREVRTAHHECLEWHFRDMRWSRIQVSLRGKSGRSVDAAEGPNLTRFGHSRFDIELRVALSSLTRGSDSQSSFPWI